MPNALLAAVGNRVREHRHKLALSRRQLSDKSGVSERFLAQLEAGSGNISLVRFAQVASALGTNASALLAGLDTGAPGQPAIALLGVRGAGKSSVGAAVAASLNLPFVELDQRIEQAAGLSLSEIFEVHGEAHYRALERQELERALDGSELVLATGGSIVTDSDSYELLRRRARTVWLRASAESHWNRVIEQGDKRPMAANPSAFSQLQTLMTNRSGLYARALHTVDTDGLDIHQVITETLAVLGAERESLGRQ